MTTTALVRIIGWKTKRPGVKAQYSRTFRSLSNVSQCPTITVISPHMRKAYTVEDYALTFRKGSVYFQKLFKLETTRCYYHGFIIVFSYVRFTSEVYNMVQTLYNLYERHRCSMCMRIKAAPVNKIPVHQQLFLENKFPFIYLRFYFLVLPLNF